MKCKCCGKAIPKVLDTIRAPREKNSVRPVQDWRYEGNQIVISRQYWPAHLEGGKRLDSVNVWDGESYRPHYKYFCKIKCAAEFGKRAYAAGYRA